MKIALIFNNVCVQLVDDDSDDEIGYEHTTENTQSNDTVDFITTNGTNDFVVKTNGFHTVENGNSLEANQVEVFAKKFFSNLLVALML